MQISNTVEANYSASNNDNDVLRKHLVLQQFSDVFLEEILGLSPHRKVDFSIELVSGATPASKAPYRMSTP